MKRILLPLAFFLFAFAAPAKAQPSTCTITGTIYRSSGAVCASCQVTLSKARRGSVPLGSGTQTFTTNASGVLPNDFQAVQNSFVTITAQVTIGRYNFQTGLEVYIPAQSSIAIESLQSAEDALLASIGATGSAATTEPFITKTATSGLSNEFALGSLATGLLKNTTTTGVPTIAVAGTDYLPAINGLTEDASPDGAADFVVTYDASATAHKKVKLNNLPGGGGGGAVSSVFGRTGTVTAASNDYTWAQIDKATSSLADIATRSASDLSSGTLPDGRFPATLPAASGANLTALNASNLASGTVPLARLSGITTSELSATAGITNAQLAGSIAAAKLVGSDIATVGTITSGVWNGTAVGAQYGGTGLNTSASTGYPSLSSGTWSVVSATTLTAALNAVVGDSGSGGTKGLVPAPAAGDAAASKYLKADGTWATVSAGGSPSGSGSEIQYRSGASTFGAVTGSSVSGANVAFAGTITQTSASATAFESGPNGGTNPVFRLVNSTASAATGLSITGNAAGSGVTLAVLSSGTNEGLILDTKGTTSNSISTISDTFNFDRSSTSVAGILKFNHRGNFIVGGNGSRTNLRQVIALDNGGGSNAPVIRAATVGGSTILFGDSDNSAPTSQTTGVQSAVAGTTNAAGATWNLRGSLGTSQGVPGRIHLTGGAMIAASGTTQQTAVDRAIFNGTKVLTNNSAITIANVTAASGSNAGGQIGYFVEVTDGTDFQYETGIVSFGVTNKGGVFSGNTATKFGNHQNATAGTLTVTVAISGANPALLSVNANSSLTPSTGYPRITYWMMNGGHQAVAPQ